MVLPETEPDTPASVPVVEAMNPVPVTMIVALPEPARIELGATFVMPGAGFVCTFTWNGNEADCPPAGAGFVTLTCTVPAVNCARGITTVIEVSALDEGENCSAPKLTIEVALKLFPFKVRVRSVVFA